MNPLRAIMDYVAAATQGRSSRWPAVRRTHLAAHPTCEACGGAAGLNVHHVKPFHKFPELELDPANLITLCEAMGCHYTFGHCHCWRGWNPDVREDAALFASRALRSRALAGELYEGF